MSFAFSTGTPHETKILHAAESPYDTSVGQLGQDMGPDENIYKAKQIADFVLSVSDLHDKTGGVQEIIKKHGILYSGLQAPWHVVEPLEIYQYGCVQAIAYFYLAIQSTTSVWENQRIFFTYEKCVRAVNALTYYLQAPHDRSNRLPAPARINKGERWKLDRTWDICVCLLGAIKVYCGFKKKLYIPDWPIVHDIHYRRAAERASSENYTHGAGHICQKALHLLTREEIAPFVQPYHLIVNLKYNESQKSLNHAQRRCSLSECQFDKDVTAEPWPAPSHPDDTLKPYHSPICPDNSKCAKVHAPVKDEPRFEELMAKRKMPAVRVEDNPDKGNSNWWVAADEKTMAVSHVWRDGIWGTKEEGLHSCIHDLLKKVARENGCHSYWIDCVTIPKDEGQRKTCIERINKTFWDAKLVLGWDEGFAKLSMDSEELTSEGFDNKLGRELLSLITSIWHRRAWTLLEGNKAQFGRLKFLQWTDDCRKYQLFDLKDNMKRALSGKVPLWILSALVELLPYSNATLPVDAAGVLLSGRHASRADDARVIWGLLRNFEPRDNAKSIPFDRPYLHADKRVDVAYISSNARRIERKNVPRSWEPENPDASVWVRTAYGGIRATVDGNGALTGEWWMKTGDDLFESVNWTQPVNGVDRPKKPTNEQDFALICPILQGDPMKLQKQLDRKSYSTDPVRGFFRTSISLECRRAILITRHKATKTTHDPWQWQTLVKLEERKSLYFSVEDRKELIISGWRNEE